MDKSRKLHNKTFQLMDDTKLIEKEIQSTLKKLDKAEYGVRSEDIKRDAARGKAITAQLLGGAVGQAVYRTKTGTWTPNADGKKYKVQTEHDWWKSASQEEKDEVMRKYTEQINKEKKKSKR